MKALNPTRTLKIENAWLREIGRKYHSLNVDIKEKLAELSEPLRVNAVVGLNAEQQRTFMAWLEVRIDEITGDPAPLNWQNQYQLESYMRAIERTRASLISQGAELILTDEERIAAQGLSFSATPTLGSQLVAPTIHQDALSFLFTRSYESLKGWNDSLSKEVRQITLDGVKNGTGIRELTDKITERTGVTRRRAELIARTETNQAYSESTLNETERAAEELGEELKVRWLSALSPTTRHRHGAWHGEIITIEEARKRKTGQLNSSDPFNCKCTTSPVVPGFGDTVKKNQKFKVQRAEFIEWEKKKAA